MMTELLVIYSSEGNRTTFISGRNDDYTALEVDRDEAEKAHLLRETLLWSREAPAMLAMEKVYDQFRLYRLVTESGAICGCGSPHGTVDRHGRSVHRLGFQYDLRYTEHLCVPGGRRNSQYIYMVTSGMPGYLRDSRYVWLPRLNFRMATALH